MHYKILLPFPSRRYFNGDSHMTLAEIASEQLGVQCSEIERECKLSFSRSAKLTLKQ